MDFSQPFTRDFWLICTIFAAVFGANIGSFLNVCIYRIPIDESVVKPRSHCMRCGKLIPWYHNLPILSYFILRGRCANCKAPFSFRYAAIELLTAMLFVVVCCQFPPTGVQPPFGLVSLTHAAVVPVAWLFLSGLIIATFVDFDHFIIPDSVSIGGMIVGVILSGLVPEIHHQTIAWRGLTASLTGLAAVFLPLQGIRLLGTAIYRRKGRLGPDEYAMGFGDIKLIGAIGAFLGWQAALFSIMAAALFGTVVAMPLVVSGHRKLLDKLPFGPYLSLGATVWLFWGPTILSAYMAMLTGPFVS